MRVKKKKKASLGIINTFSLTFDYINYVANDLQDGVND